MRDGSGRGCCPSRHANLIWRFPGLIRPRSTAGAAHQAQVAKSYQWGEMHEASIAVIAFGTMTDNSRLIMVFFSPIITDHETLNTGNELFPC